MYIYTMFVDACPASLRHVTSPQLAEQVALNNLVAEMVASLDVAENMAQGSDVQSLQSIECPNTDTANTIVPQQQVRNCDLGDCVARGAGRSVGGGMPERVSKSVRGRGLTRVGCNNDERPP